MATLLENIQGGFQSVASKLVDLTETVPAAWKAQLAAFKSRASEFARLYSDLQRLSVIASKNSQTQSEYSRVMSQGKAIQVTVMDTLSKIGQALSIMKGDGVGGLGAIPLLSIAVIAGVTYTLEQWIANAYALKAKLQTIDKAIAAGANPNEIAKEASKPLPQSQNVVGDFKDVMKCGLIIAALYFAYPVIKKALK